VIWPQAVTFGLAPFGWRGVFLGIAAALVVTSLPLAAALARRPGEAALKKAEAATTAARADIGVSANTLVTMLVLAGFSCCVAMSMPQVHIVAYCGDLGYGVARGAQMLSLMLGLGIISRLSSGVLADKLGPIAVLAAGSFMQGVALLLYTQFNGLESLFVVSGIFGLFQGGIVPMYAVICRLLLPPREAGAKIGLVVAATTFGMAFGGYVSGVIFDWTGSYRAAFLNGVAWNALNFAIVAWLFIRRARAERDSGPAIAAAR
jgi:predicted MFS family arabinose efflux permease